MLHDNDVCQFATAVRSYAHRHKIPSKREYGHTYYSQSHFDELRCTDLLADENYYTVEQVQELYGLTKANICHIVKVKHIEKTKVADKIIRRPREKLKFRTSLLSAFMKIFFNFVAVVHLIVEFTKIYAEDVPFNKS